MQFVHLHLHSGYSLLDGACPIDKLAEKAKEHNMSALALTDHGALYGAIEFYKKLKLQNIKPIIGVEFYIAPRTRFDKTPNLDKKYFHLILLAKNYEGYLNLCNLVSKSNLEGFYYKPRIDRELISLYGKNLVALTSCIQGEVSQHILNNQQNDLKETLKFYLDVWGKDFYLELQDHNIPDQKIVNKALLEIAKNKNIPVVATNDVHYLNAGDDKIHEILLCVQTKTTLNDEKRMRYNSDQFYFKSPSEMVSLFKDIPEAIANTLEISQKCNLDLPLGNPQLPKFDLPKGKTQEEYLAELTLKGIKEKFAQNYEVAKKQIDYELQIIKDKGYSAYFLILWDIVNFAKNNNIPVGPGRGSAAGSLVAFALGITSINPLQYGLFFERFLNPERVSMPDIDIDFCVLKREEIINYIKKKYGENYISQIITFGTMKARGALRDVGRVLNIPLIEVGKVAKLIPEGMDLKESLEMVPEMKSYSQKNDQYKLWIKAALGLENLPRNFSTHAAGVVISPKSLPENFPMQTGGANNTLLIQYSMEYIEDAGLVKMDILGLRTVTVIQHTIDLLKKENIFIDLNKIPLENKKTFHLLHKGKTLGIFQLEQPGMRALVMDANPTCIEDIIALIALYRPGPLQSGMKDKFLENRKKKKINYPHPLLKDILKETYGIILYQEQVMKIVNILADFTLAQADEFRKGMAKKNPEKIEQLKKPFLEGTAKKEIPKNKAEEIFALLEKFAGYGFNKSHSAAYALISYQTAYLKANYPLHYMIAHLSSIKEKVEKVAKDILECEELNIKVLPPDVNKSFEDFTQEKNNIRFGLVALKNVGKAALEIIRERNENGEYKSIFDFVSRVDLRLINKKVIESLIKCGAFINLHKNKSSLLASVELLIKYGHQVQKNKESAQLDIFSLLNQDAHPEFSLPDVPDIPQEELLKMEREVLGFFYSGHPLSKFKEKIKEKNLLTLQDLYLAKDGDKVKLAGMVSALKTRPDKREKMMANLTLEDWEESVGVLVFASCYEKIALSLKEDAFVVIEGRVDKQQENFENSFEETTENEIEDSLKQTKIIANNIFLLEDYLTEEKPSKAEIKKIAKEIYLDITDISNQKSMVIKLKNVVISYPGETKVFFTLNKDKHLYLGENFRVEVTTEFKNILFTILSKDKIKVVEE